MFSEELLSLAREVLDAARAKGLKIATAESCTGGLIAGLLTEIPGSSEVFERGFVTYSNEAKEQMLGVPHELLLKCGAVSFEIADAMARGVLAKSRADIAIAVTGIAGPGGGSAEKPVGLVYLSVMCGRDMPSGMTDRYLFGDIGRGAIRLATIDAGLKMVQTLLNIYFAAN